MVFFFLRRGLLWFNIDGLLFLLLVGAHEGKYLSLLLKNIEEPFDHLLVLIAVWFHFHGNLWVVANRIERHMLGGELTF